MKATKILTAIIEKEEDGYTALCPELDVASQGESVEEARSNLAEAVALFLECANANEIRQRRFYFARSSGLHEAAVVGDARFSGLSRRASALRVDRPVLQGWLLEAGTDATARFNGLPSGASAALPVESTTGRRE